MARAAASTSGSPPRSNFPRFWATERSKCAEQLKSGMLYKSIRTDFSQRCRMSSIGACKSQILSSGTQFRRARCASEVNPPAADSTTTPGESNRVMSLSRCRDCRCLVMPGLSPVLTALWRSSELMRELLPTLGCPTTPTLILLLPPNPESERAFDLSSCSSCSAPTQSPVVSCLLVASSARVLACATVPPRCRRVPDLKRTTG
mmetsp:Transcript_24883/g.36536  ORF Transcript_24883/g.36536 Transcript_24883/m.36536 type:complete len:204 (-) Transcript_24883:180-791(-)